MYIFMGVVSFILCILSAWLAITAFKEKNRYEFAVAVLAMILNFTVLYLSLVN